MKFFILLVVAAVALADDLSSAENHLRGHGGSHHGGISHGGSHHGGVSRGSWGRGRRDVGEDVLVVVENPNFLADQSAEEVRNRGHSGGHVGGSWGGSRGSWGGQRWRRDTDLVALVVGDDQALEASRWGGNRQGGHGSVIISGHRGGNRWSRDVDLTAEEGQRIGWGGSNWATSNQGRGSGWNHGNVWNSGISLNRRW